MGVPLALTALLLASPPIKIAAMDIRAREGVTPGLAQIITDAVTAELRKRFHGATILGADDLQNIMGFQSQKAKLGCQDTTCLAEIGGALGVDQLVTGSLAKLDTSYILNLKLIDARHPRVIAASDERLKGRATEDLLDVAGRAVEALAVQSGVALPPAIVTQSVEPVSTERPTYRRPLAIALGAAGVVAGGFAIAGLVEALSFKGSLGPPGTTIPVSTAQGSVNNANTWATVSLITGIAAVAGLGGAVIAW